MSRPFMPFYSGDWMRDTAHLDDTQERAYFRLVMFYWDRGSLPTDERQLARIANLTPAKWQKNREILASFFGENWTHRRIEKELEKSRNFIEKQRANGAKPKAKRSQEDSQNQTRAPVPQPQPSSDLGTSPKSLSSSAKRALAERFYRSYPKHVDPKDSEKKFCALVAKGEDPEFIIAAAQRYAEAQRKAGTQKQFIPAPAVWLNKGSYLNEDLPEAPVPPARAGPAKPFEKRNAWFEMLENEMAKANGNGGENNADFGEPAEDFTGETIDLSASEFHLEN